MAEKNRNPEQKARDRIDMMLEQAGWMVTDSHNTTYCFSSDHLDRLVSSSHEVEMHPCTNYLPDVT